jgi:hypothetical protein
MEKTINVIELKGIIVIIKITMYNGKFYFHTYML